MDTPLLEVLGCRQAYHKEASTDLVVLEDVNLVLREGKSSPFWAARAPESPPCSELFRACCDRPADR